MDDTPVAGVTLKVDFAGRTYTLTTDGNGVARANWNLAYRGTYYADAYDLALAATTGTRAPTTTTPMATASQTAC